MDLTYSFAAAGIAQITDAAPSGSRYFVTAVMCDNGTLAVRTYPSSGTIVSTVSTAPIVNAHLTPSGTTGYNESLEIEASAPCVATISYELQAPDTKAGAYSIKRAYQKWGREIPSQQSWTPSVLSGSYRST
jgi:hypothetical protein